MNRGALKFQLPLIYHQTRALKRRAKAARALYKQHVLESRSALALAWGGLEPKLMRTHLAQKLLLWVEVRMRCVKGQSAAGWCCRAEWAGAGVA